MLEQVAIVVVNYGSSALLAENVTRIARHSPEVSIFIVDNHTSDHERQTVRDLCAKEGWRFLPQTSNLGFGGGVNAGATVALQEGARDLLLLNPDAYIDRPNLLGFCKAAQEERNLVAAPVIVTGDGKAWFSGVSLDLETGDMRRAGTIGEHLTDWVTGACLWITAEAWEAVGEFDEEYFLYWEDVDYSVRAHRAGMNVMVVRDITAIHDEGGTQHDSDKTPRAKSGIYYYYNIRNRMLFATKHLDPVGMRAWRRTDVRAAYRILLRGGRRQFFQSTTALAAGGRAVRDARRLYRSALRQHQTHS